MACIGVVGVGQRWVGIAHVICVRYKKDLGSDCRINKPSMNTHTICQGPRGSADSTQFILL